MSWLELERLVDEVEADQALQRALKHCRSRKELILAARRLGYRITRIDLQRAWQEEQAEAGEQRQLLRKEEAS
jgi:predicted ribosomally synthesized peptide with nif11-like leader